MLKLIERKSTTFAEEIALKSRFPHGFCSAPFSQLYLHATGDVYVCCQHMGHLGNLKDKTLEELWNGPRARELRREFLSGKLLHCKKHMEQIGCHMNYDEFLKYSAFQEEQTALPRVLEVVLNGKCNIDCTMCEIKNTVMSLPDIPHFKSEIEEKLLPVLSHLYIKGGEPLIQKETYAILKKLKEVNPECSWRFTTNGQYNFNETMKKQLEGLELERVTFSVDSQNPELFKKIRINGSLKKCEESMNSIREWAQSKKQKNPVAFTTNITVQKDNWHDVPATFRRYHLEGFGPCLIYVYYPHAFSLSSLKQQEQIDIIKYFLNLPEEFDMYMGSFYHVLRPLLLLNVPQIQKLRILWDLRMQEISAKRESSS